jgi:putative NADH-flavin reductase
LTPETLAVAAVVLVMSAVGVGLIRRWATNRQTLDVPNERSSHSVPTPRGGGLMIVVGTLAGFGWVMCRSTDIHTRTTLSFLIAAILIAAISFIDDLRSLSSSSRLVAHVLTAIVIGISGRVVTVPGVELTWHAAALVTLLWIAGLTNAYNFMDGIDGIAGLQATGFVGTALREDLERRGHIPILAARRSVNGRGEYRVVGDIHSATDWSRAVEGVDVVFHLAGYAHQFGRASSDERAFFRINVEGTRRLAEQAASAGVRRLIFVSSIKANGDESPASGFDETTDPAPEDAYGRSKLAAEIALHEATRATGLGVTVVRPPLIYGPR